MDAHALSVTDFPEILRLLAEQCDTPQAAVAALALEPSDSREQVEKRLGETAEARRIIESDQPPPLGELRDIAEPVDGAARGMALPGETLFKVRETLTVSRRMREFLLARRESAPSLAVMAAPISPLAELENQIEAAIEPDGLVKDHASPELAALRARVRVLTDRISEKMQSLSIRLRDSLSDSIVTQRSGRWCLPVRAEAKGRVKGIVHDTSASGATIFIEPEAVVTLGNELRTVESAEKHEVERILAALSAAVGEHAESIAASLEACAAIDLAFAKARLASNMRAVEPDLRDGQELVLRRARHPLLDRETVVPIDIEVGRSFQSLLITGPNTGGKTVALKMAGLAVAMAQSGLQVPAAEAQVGVFPQLWADIGDEQSLQQSLSTFSAHLRNIQRMVVGAQAGALVLLDEIGAGTDPTEGAALAKALLRHFLDAGTMVLASTHYGELKAFVYNTEGMQNAAMEFDVDSLRPTYRLRVGVPGASHALTIAERYGMPQYLLDDARAGLSAEEQDVSKMLDKLQMAQRDAEAAQAAAEDTRRELERQRRELERQTARAEEARRKALATVQEQVDQVRREIREEGERLFARLREAGTAGREAHKAREELRELDRLAKEISEEIVPKPVRPRDRRTPAKGDTVRIGSYTQTGRVLSDPEEGRVQVLVGGMRMTVKLSELELVEEEAEQRPRRGSAAASSVALDRTGSISPELHLRHLRADEACSELERYLDDAVLAGLATVRIVHGKGTGALRRAVHERLRKHAAVSSFRLADPAEGGDGATIVEFKP
jgi:DNA mismatch repair protein MutS2